MINIPVNQQTLFAIFATGASLLLITLTFAGWQWHSDWQLAHKPMIISELTQTADDANQLIAAIPEQHLFGKSLSQGTVPVSNLQLQITGIVKAATGATQELSKAYISIAGQPSKIYRIGDILPYGVKIYKILSDTVIFDNDGQYEKLSLARSKLNFKNKPKGIAPDV